jgi:hypothetical protein
MVMPSVKVPRREFAPVHAFAARPIDLVEMKVPPAILAKVGEHLAVSMTALGRQLTGLGHVTPDGQAILDSGLGEVARLEDLGVRLQEVARILAGTGQPASERIDLARATREALGAWTRRVGRSAGEPCGHLEVDIDPAVLEELLHLAIHFALQSGAPVAIAATMTGTPPRPALSIRAPNTGALITDETAELNWLLFSHLARAVSLVPGRVVDAQAVTLTLTFADVDADRTDEDTASLAEVSHTAALTGHRVLIVEPRDAARLQAHGLLRDAGMHVDASANVVQAQAALRDGRVDVVVTGIPIADAACAHLIDEMRAAEPRLRIVELVDDSDAFAFSVPGSDRPARVGREDMARTLARAVAQEIDAA